MSAIEPCVHIIRKQRCERQLDYKNEVPPSMDMSMHVSWAVLLPRQAAAVLNVASISTL